MAIETTERCDVCGAEIEKDVSRPGFPQLSWCYFQKGLGVFRNGVTGEPLLQSAWQGSVNRLEFCAEHGRQLNAILKAFSANDPGLAAFRELFAEDTLAAAKRDEAARNEYDAAKKAWDDEAAAKEAAAAKAAEIAENRAKAAETERASAREALAAAQKLVPIGGKTP